MMSHLYVYMYNLNISMPLQFAPLLSPKSISHAHHILVFLCEGMNLTGHPDVGVKQKCDGISEEVQPCKYATIIGGWAIGGNVSNIAIKLYNYCITKNSKCRERGRVSNAVLP